MIVWKVHFCVFAQWLALATLVVSYFLVLRIHVRCIRYVANKFAFLGIATSNGPFIDLTCSYGDLVSLPPRFPN